MPYDPQNPFASADSYPDQWVAPPLSAWPNATSSAPDPRPNPVNPGISNRLAAWLDASPATRPLSFTLIPVDYDPSDEDRPVTPPDPSLTASHAGRSFTFVPVDHDLFAETYAPFHHDPFNASWAAGTPADRYAFGTLPQLGPGPTNVPAGQWAQINSVPPGQGLGPATPGSALGQPVAGWPSTEAPGWQSPTRPSFAPLTPLQSPFGTGEFPWATSSSASSSPPDSLGNPAGRRI